MTTVYNLCKLLIQKNRTDGLQDKMDVYLAADRLTPRSTRSWPGCLPRKEHKKAARMGGGGRKGRGKYTAV